MEDISFKIIKNQLPKEWVIREFNNPDYGVDLVIELFDIINSNTAEYLGEYLYVQVKSVQKLEIKKEKIYPVQNVAKGGWQIDKAEYMEIDVIKFDIDTNSIYTVQSLGSSISFMLLVVDIETKNVYFICLNDFIDKILLPKKPNYSNQKNVRITIPTANNLSRKDISKSALEFYGKRAKLLSAFAKFSYQRNELSYLLNYTSQSVNISGNKSNNDYLSDSDIKKQVLFFIQQIDRLEIWDYEDWQILPILKTELIDLKSQIVETENMNYITDKILRFWNKLNTISSLYEEITREWYLPKFLSFITSYPNETEIIKRKK